MDSLEYRQANQGSVHLWEHGIVRQEMQGIWPSSRGEREVSWVFSS